MSKVLEQVLLKAQEQEENIIHTSGRGFGKELIYLKQCLEQCSNKPILYMSRKYGNKYIIPQEEYEKVLNRYCSKCVNRENNICVGMNAPIGIETLINCIEMLSTELKEENQELKEKNQELKVKADRYDSAQRIVLSTKDMDIMMKLQTENEKLRKAMEILKRVFELEAEKGIYSNKEYYFINYSSYAFFDNEISRQEYELLKEVLKKYEQIDK